MTVVNTSVTKEGGVPVISDGGVQFMPVEQQQQFLTEYDKRRKNFREWLMSHFKQGFHFGFPPGCEPRNVDPLQWISKPSLYKAGAELAIDLAQLRVEYEADIEAWNQLGAKAGQFVTRCRLFTSDGAETGMGRGVFVVGEKGMKENGAMKMSQKRALVDAVINVFRLSDLFTQDLEDLPQARPEPGRDRSQPIVAERDRRTAEAPDLQAMIVALYARWRESLNGGASDKQGFQKWVASATESKDDLAKPENWSIDLVLMAQDKLQGVKV
jgi:hypothetical protein